MTDFSDITAVILTGGLGIRLRPIVSDRPKALAGILGRPFLTFLLDQLVCAGTREVVLCTGYMADMIEEKFGSYYKSLGLTYSREKKPLGTGGALRLSLPHIRSDTVLVMNGDSFIDTDLNAYIDWFFGQDSDASLLLTWVHNSSHFGKVSVSKNGLIDCFKEKADDKAPGWINAGIYMLRKTLLEIIPPGKVHSLERDFFPVLVNQRLCGYRCNGLFIDIGTPESYARAAHFFSQISR